MPKKINKLFRLSQVTTKGKDGKSRPCSSMYATDKRRAIDILMEAQHFWENMQQFRDDRERNKRYVYGDQWGDLITYNGKKMTEEQYIKEQGNIPLTNNLTRRLVRSVIGVYRSQAKEPTCKARDRDEQKLSETMSTILQCNMQLNRMEEIYARSMEEFLISGFVVHRKSYGWRNGKVDCWTDVVPPNNFFVDCNMRDLRGWDASCLGEIHDISFGQLCEQFATCAKDYERLKEIYRTAADKNHIASYMESFGYNKRDNFSFLYADDPSRCRVIEVWRKEQKPRYRCHDYQNGDIFKINIEDYATMVEAENSRRIAMAAEVGIAQDDVPIITAEWFVDDCWYYYFISPFGDILQEGETPYEHGSYPYVFKAYPFIDGEIHSFVSDFIDQQRYTNRLITLYDWIIRSSAKGVLMMPDDCLSGQMSMEEIAKNWTAYNGIIVYKPSNSGRMPEQISANSTNIGIAELLNIQLKFFEEISGVNGALQGKPGFSGTSAALYNMQTQNATTSLVDLLSAFSNFVKEAAYKDVKNMQQFYDDKRVFNISGKTAQIEYDPEKMRDVEFDLSIVESTTTPTYRMLSNDILMQLFQSQAISVEQLLENGDFPFADDLLQSIQSQKQQIEKGEIPDGVSPEIMAQVQQGANMDAVNKLQGAMTQ